jgi:CheY-like chemotaxis protein
MAGEPILIVDDTPVNLKLTRILLVNEGYKVLTAGSAEEALELLGSYHPHLILADIQLPGMDGLEFTRRLKQDEKTRDIVVVALTAFAMKGDEQKAVDAGCDGYITKPIDTRALGERIRGYLQRRTETRPTTFPAEVPVGDQGETSIGVAEMDAIRRRFLAEGQEQSRALLLDLDGAFNADATARAVHQWVGTGGLLGYTAISRLSREVEATLHEKPLDNAQLREALTNLVMAFSSPREARDKPVPETIIQALAGKRIAVAGFSRSEKERLCVALERAQAKPEFFDAFDPPDSPEALECDLAVVHVQPGAESSPWLDPASPAATKRPAVFVGERDDLLALPQPVQSMAREFLMDSWLPEEALVRLSLAISQRPTVANWSTPQEPAGSGFATQAPAPPLRAHVVIADDDSSVLALVRTALQNFGMECRTAVDGPSALDLIREGRPHAAVLDVNMPGMDGYEVLSAVRADQIPVRILLLTARQQESDVLRGFALGADDYVVKPFSPMELVARLKRLLGR